MEKSNGLRGSYLNGAYHPSLSSSRADVNYSCGSCGYELNLSSNNRNTSTIGSNKYGKSIKRGIISFFQIDDSRFTQVDELQCKPHFSKRSWGLFSRRTKLLCRKCGKHIGNAYDDYTSSSFPLVLDGSDSSSGRELSKCRKYDVRIRSLQPSNSEECDTPIFGWHIWAGLVCIFLHAKEAPAATAAEHLLLQHSYVWGCSLYWLDCSFVFYYIYLENYLYIKKFVQHWRNYGVEDRKSVV